MTTDGHQSNSSTPDGVELLTVGVDGSRSAEHALDWALVEARRRRLLLQIVNVWRIPLMVPGPSATLSVSTMMRTARLYGQHAVDAAAKRAADAGVATTTELLEGHAATELLRLAQGSDQLVVGARGGSAVGRFLLGSVSTAVTHHCTRPVTVVREKTRPARHRVVVGIDGSSFAAAALRRAAVEASAARAQLQVIAAWQLMDSDLVGDFIGSTLPQRAEVHAWVEARAAHLVAEELGGWTECPVRLDVVHAPPVRALLGAAAGADLLVVGTRGRGAFDRMLLGSVSSACIHHARCPVQVVPS